MRWVENRNGFTIVELLVVIIVIGILAALTTFGFIAVREQSQKKTAETYALDVANKLKAYATNNSGNFPANLDAIEVKDGAGVTYQYVVDNNAAPRTYCVIVTAGTRYSYKIERTDSKPVEGTVCASSSGIADGVLMQTVTNANCPITRTRAVDARDNRTYWVQKLADGKCWMLTNLAYAGGGTNTYGDTRTLSSGMGDTVPTYTVAKYYTPLSANATTNPTAPSTATNGTGQAGYFYNWCAAMGGQATAACAEATTPTPNQTISICPNGWRLPSRVAGVYDDYYNLNAALTGNTAFNSDAALLNTWLAQRAGYWAGVFANPDNTGYYWTAAQYTAGYAYALGFSTNFVSPATTDAPKMLASGVRCLASS